MIQEKLLNNGCQDQKNGVQPVWVTKIGNEDSTKNRPSPVAIHRISHAHLARLVGLTPRVGYFLFRRGDNYPDIKDEPTRCDST